MRLPFARLGLMAFPFAALLNSFSMTALLLVFGLFGDLETAADIGLLQGATLALFYAFSANARYLILAPDENAGSTAISLLKTRLILVLPLAFAAWYLSVEIGGASQSLAVALIARRAAEWMGEIGLACQERLNRKRRAYQALVAETSTFLFAVFAPLGWGVDLSLSVLPWVFAPLLVMRGVQLAGIASGGLGVRALLPHFGSTAIIGASVFVFRISIVLLVGKALAGSLFTAFALGGLIPTVFGQALAPTLMHRYGRDALPRVLWLVPAAMAFAGGVLTATALAEPEWLASVGRPGMFWLATGLSIIGGALMLVALALRARLIHSDDGRKVFGPDLLANVLIAICVPYVYYILGVRSLAGLYLLSAGFSLVFLFGVSIGHKVIDRHVSTFLLALGALLVLPVFVQIESGLFADPSIVFDTQLTIQRLPIPLSVLATFCGIALIGNYPSAARTLTVLFFTALLFVMTSLAVSKGDPGNESAKLILMAQFLLPIFALAFGEMYGAASYKPFFERAALVVLAVVLPLQLLASWLQGDVVTRPLVFFFSIYQHFEYFPMVVAALVLMATPALWHFSRFTRGVLAGLMPIAAIQLAASVAISALAGMISGLVAWVVLQRRADGERDRLSMAAVSLCALLGIGYMLVIQPGSSPCAPAQLGSIVAEEHCGNEDMLSQTSSTLPSGVSRTEAWRFHAHGVLQSPREFLFGHTTRPDRSRYPSAQNYWLDALYNFGAVAILPLFVLVIVTVRMLWNARRSLVKNPVLLGTALSAAYLLLVESNLTVAMRQPYPGIISFFVWGLLLARLQRMGSGTVGGVPA